MLSTSRLERLAHRAVFPASVLPSGVPAVDAHLHTTYTDGRSSVAAMLEAAATAGLRAAAFTEHVRRGITWFGEFLAEVEACRGAVAPLEVWVGIEAKAFDTAGSLDADATLIARADLVLGAFHGFPDGAGGFLPASRLEAERAFELEYRVSLGLLAQPELDVLAHPGALSCKHFGGFPAEMTRELVREAARRGKAIELNAEYAGVEELARTLDWCIEAGAWVTLGSNAHAAEEVGRIVGRVEAALALREGLVVSEGR